MAQNPGQRRAADRVADEMAHRGWGNTDLRNATAELDGDDPPVDLGTIGDFLAYKRWPKITTLAKLERVFEWPAGSLRRLALTGEVIPMDATVNAPPISVTLADKNQLSEWLTRTESEMTDEQMEELWLSAENVLEALKARVLAERERGSTLGNT